MKQPKEKSRISPVYESFPSLEFSKLGCYVHMHIFCLNVSVYIEFG